MFGFVKVIQPLKLSFPEAIRMGARLRPQIRGTFSEDGKGCALTAAYEIATGKLPESLWDILKVPFVLRRHFDVSWGTMGEVLVWNDKCGYSREHIASILERKAVENKLR